MQLLSTNDYYLHMGKGRALKIDKKFLHVHLLDHMDALASYM